MFDAKKYFQPGDIKDHLIRSSHLACALASHFSNSPESSTLDRSVVLMRGHGMTVVGSSIEHAVFRAVYAQNNAVVQTTALLLSNAYLHSGISGVFEGKIAAGEEVVYMDDEEVVDSIKINVKTAIRPWRSWAREAEASGLYITLV